MKKRVAVWLFGGIGTGNFSQGQPALEKLLLELSRDFKLVVFSRSYPNREYSEPAFTIKSAPPFVPGQILRWLWLCFSFAFEHLRGRFSLLCAFWGFPGGFLATLCAKIFRLPVLIHLGGGDSAGIPEVPYGIMHRPLFKKLATWAYMRATVLCTLTRFQKEGLTKFGINRSVTVIPFGPDLRKFQFIKKGVPTDRIRLLHVSNFSPIKDFPSVLKTMAILARTKNVWLDVIGGDYPASSIALSKELGIHDRVRFVGAISHNDMPLHYKHAHVLLHSSIFEGQGIVIAEAAASGVLIAGTRVGLISDLGEPGAVVVAVGDHDALAEKVLHILDSTDLWDQKIQCAHRWSEEHDFFWTVKQFTQVFHDIS